MFDTSYFLGSIGVVCFIILAFKYIPRGYTGNANICKKLIDTTKNPYGIKGVARTSVKFHMQALAEAAGMEVIHNPILRGVPYSVTVHAVFPDRPDNIYPLVILDEVLAGEYATYWEREADILMHHILDQIIERDWQ